LLLVNQDGRRVRLLERSFFQVNTLDLKNWRLGFGAGGGCGIGHGMSLKKSLGQIPGK
jgi:hypothetical protein